MIGQHLWRLGLRMRATIVHEEDSFFVSELLAAHQYAAE
jgi:hypothetical protein